MGFKIVRIGKVSSVNAEKARVQVVFTDMDNMVSSDLPIIYPQGLTNKFYAVPDVGENVLCLFMEESMSDGFCIGAFYTDNILPPVTSNDKVHLSFQDGTHIEYDRKEHKLIADVIGDVEIKATNSVTVKCKTLSGEFEDGNISGNGMAVSCKTLSATCDTASINAQNVNLSGSTIILSGSVTIGEDVALNGNISLTGNISLNGSVSCPGYCKC